MSGAPTVHIHQQAHGLLARLCWLWPLLSGCLLLTWWGTWWQSGSPEPAVWWGTAMAMVGLLWGAWGTWQAAQLGSGELHFDGDAWMWSRAREGLARVGPLQVVLDGGAWVVVRLSGHPVQLGTALAPTGAAPTLVNRTAQDWLLITRSDAASDEHWRHFRRAIHTRSPLKSAPPPII